MITIYLLKNCKHCKKLFNYINKNSSMNICLIFVSKNEIPKVKLNEPRIVEFPAAFYGNPKINGFPNKNSRQINGGTDQILNVISKYNTNFGNNNLVGSVSDIDYSSKDIKNFSMKNIYEKRNSCFGKTYNILDRPFGSYDNQFLLQGYQPCCANPIRSNLPIKKTKFGTTPGTKEWLSQKEQVQLSPKILLDSSNIQQNLKSNTDVKLNQPRTFSDDYLNQNCKSKNNFGNKFISPPVNYTLPYLTWAAGSDGVSRITGKKFYNQQQPIGSPLDNVWVTGDIKKYTSIHEPQQQLLAGGLNINSHGTNKYGKKLISKSNKSNKSSKPNKLGTANKLNKSSKSKRKVCFTSPLGIEISFD